jgi:hypothetical protein
MTVVTKLKYLKDSIGEKVYRAGCCCQDFVAGVIAFFFSSFEELGVLKPLTGAGWSVSQE